MSRTFGQISRRQLELKLEDLMAEDRYWMPSDPEREQLRADATLGFQLLYPTPPDDSRGKTEWTRRPSLFHDQDQDENAKRLSVNKLEDFREVFGLLSREMRDATSMSPSDDSQKNEDGTDEEQGERDEERPPRPPKPEELPKIPTWEEPSPISRAVEEFFRRLKVIPADRPDIPISAGGVRG